MGESAVASPSNRPRNGLGDQLLKLSGMKAVDELLIGMIKYLVGNRSVPFWPLLFVCLFVYYLK